MTASSLDLGLVTALLAGGVRAGTSLFFAALGELVYERSGVLNLGLEGMMLCGALAAVWAQLRWESWPFAVAVAIAVGMGVGLVHGLIAVTLGGNQIVLGLAFVIFGQGITSYLGNPLVGQRINPDLRFAVPVLSHIPVLGEVFFHQDVLVYLTLPLALAVWVFLMRTRAGVVLRAAGEDAEAAAARGVDVFNVRIAAGAFCGGMSGLAGAYLALAYAGQWQEHITAGRGWIALVLVIIAFWRPVTLLAVAFLFGVLASLNLVLQAWAVETSQYLLEMVPFLLSIGVLVIGSIMLQYRPVGMPSELGKPFRSSR